MNVPRATSPDWNALYSQAAQQGGYFTARQAAQVGYSGPLLHHHVHHGRMERWGRGILRLVHFPPTEHAELVPHWLWSGMQGTHSHETALMLQGISDAHPAKNHLTVPSAWSKRRLRVPTGLVLHFADVPHDERTWMGPLPITTALRAVADCSRAHVEPDIIRDAIRDGARMHLFHASTARAEAKRAQPAQER